MIKVVDIHKGFGDQPVLKGIDTEFEKGKTNVIIGQSGSGKTVLLKCLLGLFTPDKGDIFYDNKSLLEMDDDQKRNLREKIGMLFQGGALFDSMNIEEDVMFPLRMFTKQKKSEMLDRVHEVLKGVNLEDVNKKFPDEISGGMQKRVSIAGGIVDGRVYVLFGEPDAG